MKNIHFGAVQSHFREVKVGYKKTASPLRSFRYRHKALSLEKLHCWRDALWAAQRLINTSNGVNSQNNEAGEGETESPDTKTHKHTAERAYFYNAELQHPANDAVKWTFN